MQSFSTAGMCKYVGHHYILISMTFPQLAQPTSQDAPIRPNSSPEPKSGQLLTNASDLMKDAAALCHSVQLCRYTALCGLAPASLHFEAVDEVRLRDPQGYESLSMHSVPGKAKSTAWMNDRPSKLGLQHLAPVSPLYVSFTVDLSGMFYVTNLSS